MSEEIQRINLNDYIQTGEGGTALTYTKKDGLSLAKLYKPGFEADRFKAEFLTARIVFDLGIPSPKPYRMITDGERSGAEYELIKNKRSYTRIISARPTRKPSTRPPSASFHTTQPKSPTCSTWSSAPPCPTQPCRKS